MQKFVGVLMLLLAIGVMILFAGNAVAGTLSWSPPNLYTDNTVISAADKAAAIYTPAISNASVGPWTDQANTPPGATSATVPNAGPGQTRWYSVKVTINGQPSAYATAVSYTAPFQVPGAASGLTFTP